MKLFLCFFQTESQQPGATVVKVLIVESLLKPFRYQMKYISLLNCSVICENPVLNFHCAPVFIAYCDLNGFVLSNYLQTFCHKTTLSVSKKLNSSRKFASSTSYKSNVFAEALRKRLEETASLLELLSAF